MMENKYKDREIHNWSSQFKVGWSWDVILGISVAHISVFVYTSNSSVHLLYIIIIIKWKFIRFLNELNKFFFLNFFLLSCVCVHYSHLDSLLRHETRPQLLLLKWLHFIIFCCFQFDFKLNHKQNHKKTKYWIIFYNWLFLNVYAVQLKTYYILWKNIYLLNESSSAVKLSDNKKHNKV